MSKWYDAIGLPTEILSPCCNDLIDLETMECFVCGATTLREGWKLMYWYDGDVEPRQEEGA